MPAGAAHGYCPTTDLAELAYLLSSPFNAALELEIHPFDHEIDVTWPVTGEPILSPKDASAPTLAQRSSANELPLFT